MSRALSCLLLILWLTGCVTPPPPQPEAVARAERALQSGVTAYGEQMYADAAGHFREALALYEGMDDRKGVLQSRLNLAETAIAVDNRGAARRYLAAAAGLATEGLAAWRPRIALLQARLARVEGERAAARAHLAPLLPRFDPEERPVGEVTALGRAALAERTALAFAEAEEEARWTRRLANSLDPEGNPLLAARLQRFQARLAEDPAEAEGLLTESLRRYKAALHRPGIAATLGELAERRMAAGEWAQAEQYLLRSLAVRAWILDRPGTVQTLKQLAAVSRARGETERAGVLMQWADAVDRRDFAQWPLLRSTLLAD